MPPEDDYPRERDPRRQAPKPSTPTPTPEPLLLGDPSLASGREMWSWSGKDWVLLTGARLPAFPGGAVTDTVDGHVVGVGSLAEPVLGAPKLLHIWPLSGSTWRQLA